MDHTLEETDGDVSKKALDWNPKGQQIRDRPRKTWNRTLDQELRQIGNSWGEVKGRFQIEFAGENLFLPMLLVEDTQLSK